MCRFRMRGRSQGSSFRNRCIVSNVAPPQTSTAQNPTPSILSAMGIMSSVVIRVAKMDWWPSRKVLSWNFTGPMGLSFWSMR